MLCLQRCKLPSCHHARSRGAASRRPGPVRSRGPTLRPPPPRAGGTVLPHSPAPPRRTQRHGLRTRRAPQAPTRTSPLLPQTRLLGPFGGTSAPGKNRNQNQTKQGRTRARSTGTRHGPSPMPCADARRPASSLCPHCADARRPAPSPLPALRRRAPPGPAPSTPHCAVARRSLHVRDVRPAEPTSEESRGRHGFPRPDCSLGWIQLEHGAQRIPWTHASSRNLPRPEWHGPTVPATLAGLNPLLAAARGRTARLESRGFVL